MPIMGNQQPVIFFLSSRACYLRKQMTTAILPVIFKIVDSRQSGPQVIFKVPIREVIIFLNTHSTSQLSAMTEIKIPRGHELNTKYAEAEGLLINFHMTFQQSIFWGQIYILLRNIYVGQECFWSPNYRNTITTIILLFWKFCLEKLQ